YQALDVKTKLVTLAIGVSDSVVRHADLPAMPIGDMRQILKNNTKNYLQQDLPGHVFDCYIIPPRGLPKHADKGKSGGLSIKQKVLATGEKKKLSDNMQTAIKNTGLIADHIVPGLVGPVNTFEMAMPEVFSKEVFALVDIGFRNTTICLIQE